MTTEAQAQYSARLIEIVQELDISPGQYQQAVERYEAVGDWLDRPDSLLHPYRPRIHSQGSFRFGTVVRPIAACQNADYDIDLVCQLQAARDDDRSEVQELPRKSAESIKQMVGDRLKANATYERMLDEEGGRCWTLQYSEQNSVGFHVDILPSIPEKRAVIEVMETSGVPLECASP